MSVQAEKITKLVLVIIFFLNLWT